MQLKVRLRDPAHRLPMPGTARLFGAVSDAGGRLVDCSGVETIDLIDHGGFWVRCLRDGSIEEVPAPGPEPADLA